MNFDISVIPFSRSGSFLTVSRLKEGVYLRTVHGGDSSDGAVFKLELTQEGQAVDYESTASPSKLVLTSERGVAELCLADIHTVRIRASGIGIRLRLATGNYDYAVPIDAGRWEVNHFTTETRFVLTPIAGEITVDAPWNGTRCSHVTIEATPAHPAGSVELKLEEYVIVRPGVTENPPFEECAAEVDREFRRWLNHSLPGPKGWEPARELAAYITWSSIVHPAGRLKRPAMYMSKNWMTNIWSWDHCFNAMALIRTRPELAWDQFMIFFDIQDESGLLPDFANDKYALWNCCKPPIHGWALRWMMKRSSWIGERQLQEVYGPLSRWAHWWFRHRLFEDEGGVPHYLHGNDSGWDNSTVFLQGGPLQSPDLCAYLVLQCETLAEIAETLGKEDEAQQWKALADHTLDSMLKLLWKGDKFTALRAGRPLEEQTAESLILHMPAILGKRLPDDVFNRLVQGLADSKRFFTPYGFATESISSPYYTADGYWRGPIWAPVMMLLVDGLSAAGETELARDAARKFCQMAVRSGMAENFDALTGEGLRDRAFTWTSSVYLILANEYM